MPKQKTFKRRVRARMEKTGESYTAARRVLIADGDRPEIVETPWEPPVAEAKLIENTDRTWKQWFAVLDDWGAITRTHTEIAKWLEHDLEVPHWWAQSITLGYERARGRRVPGQRADGFVLSASKTIAVPIDELFDAFVELDTRERWLPGADLRERTATRPKSIRYDWEDGTTRVNVGFEAMAGTKSRVALSHERLPDADTADEMKVWWRDRLATLKTTLEGDQ